MYHEFQVRFFGGAVGAFDGSKNSYYARDVIRAESKTFPAFEFKLEPGERVRTFMVKLQRGSTFTIDCHRIQDILIDATKSMPMLKALDVVLHCIPSLRKVSVGRSFFSSTFQDAHPLGGVREVRSDSYQSVHPTMGWKLMLNTATAFYAG